MRTSLSSLLATAGLVVAAAPAHANDAKMHPGTACDNDTLTLRHSLGSVVNESTTSAAIVECPVIKDSSGAAIVAAIARVFNGHPTDQLWCGLYTRSFGQSVVGFTDDTTPGGGGFDTLSFASIAGGAITDYAYLICVLPKASNGLSKVIAYRTVEANA